MFLHSVDGDGANFTWPNPLAALAVMDPEVPVVTSLTTACNPLGVSCSCTVNRSPWLRNSTLRGFGVPDFSAWNCTGLGGPCGMPLCVRYAKFTYSSPTVASQVEFSCLPVSELRARLSMVSATHH